MIIPRHHSNRGAIILQQRTRVKPVKSRKSEIVNRRQDVCVGGSRLRIKASVGLYGLLEWTRRGRWRSWSVVCVLPGVAGRMLVSGARD
jgi:hypothetical protein